MAAFAASFTHEAIGYVCEDAPQWVMNAARGRTSIDVQVYRPLTAEIAVGIIWIRPSLGPPTLAFSDSRTADLDFSKVPTGLSFCAANFWRNQQENWFAGRPDDDPGIDHLCTALEGDECGAVSPFSPTMVSPEVVAKQVLSALAGRREPSDEGKTSRELAGLPPLDARHLAEASDTEHESDTGERRETIALSRFLHHDIWEIAAHFGLGPMLWCGINIRKSTLFGENLSGDVDVLLGGFELDVSQEEYEARLIEQRRRWPLTTHPSRHHESVRMELLQGERARWPPRLDHLVAFEVKYSYYDPTNEKAPWRATHRGATRRIVGQLKFLAERGFPRVMLLQLASVRPVVRTSGWRGIQQSGALARMAHEAWPPLLNPTEHPRFGYLRTVLAAVPEYLEHEAGTRTPIEVVSEGARLDTVNSGWTERLHAQLEQLGRPTQAVAWIVDDGGLRYRHHPPGLFP